MALKKPLVLTNGQIEQLQSGDYIGEVNLPTATNGNAGTLSAGMVIYHTATASTIDKARSNASGTMDASGFVVADITTGATGTYQDSGVLSLTTTQWDAVTGQTGGLTSGSLYYVDPSTAGKITTTVPSTVSQFVQKVGRAVNTTDMHILLKQSIKL